MKGFFIGDKKYAYFEAYFELLFKHCNLTPKGGNPWYALEAAYEEPPRAYHNIHHAVGCAMMAESYRLPPLGIMALLYHDAHHVAGSIINKDESVNLLYEHFSDWRKDLQDKPLPHPDGPSPLEEIARLIRVTKHDIEPATPLEAIVMDIDMSILGSEPAVFDAYEEAIRVEYDFASDADVEKGRVDFLKGLLSKRQIYYSTLLRHRFEKPARENIHWRIHRAKLAELQARDCERNAPCK